MTGMFTMLHCRLDLSNHADDCVVSRERQNIIQGIFG